MEAETSVLKVISALFALALPALAAIGDNAPAVPSTWVIPHPRLGAPSNAQLLAIWNSGAMVSRWSVAANAWDSTCTSQNCDAVSFRYLLEAYQASKAGGTPNATWKQKLLDMQNMGPVWGRKVMFDDTAVGNGTSTVTDASVNFLTGCLGGSCAGDYVTFLGLRYVVGTVVNANTITLTKIGGDQPYGFPNGTGMKMRILNNSPGPGDGVSLLGYATMYDQMQSDFTAPQLADMQTAMMNMLPQMENNYTVQDYSPFNDQAYSNGSSSWRGHVGFFAAAFALYPDVPASIMHVRWAMDYMQNRMLPAWKMVMLGNGDPAKNGGMWHEAWNDYQVGNGSIAMRSFIVTVPLMWANASGKGVPYVFGTGCLPNCNSDQYPWLKNWAYQTMYLFRPDFAIINYGAAQPFPSGEGQICNSGTNIGALNGLAEIYNDTVLRGWARLLNTGGCATFLDGNEPSAFPYYTPDKTANTAAGWTTNTLTSDPRATLPLCRHFTGAGVLVCRSDWTEYATWFTFQYGDSFWSHQHMDTGHFNIFSHGNLAIDSGSYQPGSFSWHNTFYGSQTIAHNTITVKDPADAYTGTGQYVEVIDSTGLDNCQNMPNDGGQRRRGSGWQNFFSNGTCTGGFIQNTRMVSIDDTAMWYRGRSFYHTGALMNYVAYPNETSPKYVEISADLTTAYQTDFSGNAAMPGYGTSNRSQRLQRFYRNMVVIFRAAGHGAYFIDWDQITSTNPTFVKKWLIHSINQPTIDAPNNKITITRADNAAGKPYPGTWPNAVWQLPLLMSHRNDTCTNKLSTNDCYQYAGNLIVYSVPVNGTNSLTAIGGAGHEFDDGTGTNQNQCQPGQHCANDATDYGFGSTALNGCATSHLCPEAAAAPMEPGAWRVEVSPAAAAQPDYFLHVMLATSTTDPIIITTAPTALSSGSGLAAMSGVTWKEGTSGAPDTCTYTLMFHKFGVGTGTIQATGTTCANTL